MAEEQRFEEGHRLCANNCGFFGSPATLDLCSKCYRDHCVEEERQIQDSAAGKVATENSRPTSDPSIANSSATRAAITVLDQVEEAERKEDRAAVLDQINEQVCIWQPDQTLKDLFSELTDTGYIGDDPMRYWTSNKVTCKLDIKNPDLTIEDRPLKHVTPQMQEAFRRHIKILLDLKVIRPSTSRHRTAAIIVQSGTSVDPQTGKETKGKERMVFNYKRLNDNTNKDQYSLPGINTIIHRVGRSKIYSKFDLKSGFHQVAMHPDSIPWTAFWVPEGLFEWLVMPFGLKNAPAIFQRKMDHCFQGTEQFIAVYIDDILVFSETEEQHRKHLKILLEICKKNGLILSPTKMKIGTSFN